MYVITFDRSYGYQEWAKRRLGEIRIISVTSFRDELVVTYEVI